METDDPKTREWGLLALTLCCGARLPRKILTPSSKRVTVGKSLYFYVLGPVFLECGWSWHLPPWVVVSLNESSEHYYY